MSQNRSFKDYISNQFYNELFVAVSSYLEENCGRLDIYSRHVKSIDCAELSEIYIKSVDIENLPDMKIAFEVLLEAEFQISENNRNYDRYDEKSGWFKVSCSGDLSKNLKDFNISSVESYNYRNSPIKPMSDALVPIIRAEQLEDAATEFLSRHYPESLKSPIPVNPYELVKRMSLSVQMKSSSSDCSVFGQIFFTDCETEYYDKQEKKFKKIHVGKGTIFVDQDAYYLRNLGSVNNTIIHECVHWDLHRKAFELERLYNENATHIQCQVVGGIKDSSKSATDWMEWQANSLTPRILMPYKQTSLKVAEIIRKHKSQYQTTELADIIEGVIDELAQYFNVSRQSAKIRMIDLGYDEAMGAFIFIDGHYIKPHSFKRGILKRNQTFSISEQDAIIQSITNADLRNKINSGDYIFAESHFCINHPKYIKRTENKTHLTDYARFHIDECCLIFNLNILKSPNNYCKEYYTECVLYRDSLSDITFEAHYNTSPENDTVDNRAKMLCKQSHDLSELLSYLPHKFNEALVYLMKRNNVTVEALAEASGMEPKTIQRLRTDENYTSTLETIIAVCIGLHLHPLISEALINCSTFRLKLTTDLHVIYKHLLTSCYTKSIQECNETLIAANFSPLTKEK